MASRSLAAYSFEESIMEESLEALDLLYVEAKKYDPLELEEELEYGRRSQKGDEEAQHLLVMHNLRFAISVAKKYQNRGLDLADLVQLAFEGSVIASKRFDPDKGVKFISYAVWWIRQSILKGLAEAKPLKTPMNVIALRTKIFRFVSSYKLLHGSEPTTVEIAQACDINETRVLELEAIDIVSLDAPRSTKESDQTTFHQTLNHSTGDLFEEIAENDQYSWRKNELLNILKEMKQTDRNKQMFIERHCLDGEPESGEAPTLESIAEKYEITRERVRQIVEKIELKIRAEVKKRVAAREFQKKISSRK